MSESTSSRGARGAVVTILGQGAKAFVALASVMILGRLLTPDAFGLVAMVAVFSAFGQQLRDFGIPTVALQARRLSKQQASNLFWVNTFLGALVAGALWLAAPAISAAYSEPRLLTIIPLASAAIFLGGLQSQQQIQMARALRFSAIVITDIASQILALFVAVYMAMAGLGYLALAWQPLVAAALLTVLRFGIGRFIPFLPRKDGETLTLVKSGLFIGGAQFTTFLSTSIAPLVIGIRFNAQATGFYDRAYDLAQKIPNSIIGPLMGVAIPILNRMRDEGVEVNQALYRIQRVLSFLGVLGMLILAASAPWLVTAVLGDQWGGSVVLFQLLVVSGAVLFSAECCYWAFLLHNQSRALFGNDVVAKSILVVLVVLASFISVECIAAAFSLGIVIGWFINLLTLRKRVNYPSLKFLRMSGRFLLSGVLAFLASQLVATAFTAQSARVLSSVIAAVCVYLVLSVCTRSGRKEVRSLFTDISTMIQRRPK